ncbi:SRPBCC family protein [Virgibacillus ainsalahensis]
MSTLIVTDEIIIHAPPSKVWDILAKPEYIRKWDDLPENFPEETVEVGTEMKWNLPSGGFWKHTVIKAEKNKELQLDLCMSNWRAVPKAGEIKYAYQLLIHGDGTRLRMRHGDFALLHNGKDYYEASAEFAAVAKQKIKQLSEESFFH